MVAVVDIRSVRLRVDERIFLDGASLRVEAGQTVVVAGLPGCGKSLLPRLVLGLPGIDRERYSLEGRVVVGGEDLTDLSGPGLQALRRRIGSVMRYGGLIENMDIRDNITLPLSYHFRDTRGGSWIQERCDAILEQLGQPHLGVPGLRPVGLDREERVYASLARALVCEPFLLLLDDPCAGLSPGSARRLVHYLFAHEPTFAESLPGPSTRVPGARPARLVTTADLGCYLEVGDRFCLLWEGRIEDLGEADQVRSNRDPRVRQLMAGPATGLDETDAPHRLEALRG